MVLSLLGKRLRSLTGTMMWHQQSFLLAHATSCLLGYASVLVICGMCLACFALSICASFSLSTVCFRLEFSRLSLLAADCHLGLRLPGLFLGSSSTLSACSAVFCLHLSLYFVFSSDVFVFLAFEWPFASYLARLLLFVYSCYLSAFSRHVSLCPYAAVFWVFTVVSASVCYFLPFSFSLLLLPSLLLLFSCPLVAFFGSLYAPVCSFCLAVMFSVYPL